MASVSYTVTAPAPREHRLTVRLAGSGRGKVSDAGGGLSCRPRCSHAYADGSRVTLHARPARGSRFSGFSGAGCSGTGPCTVTLTAPSRVTATFTRNKHQLAPAHLRITRVSAKAVRAGCETELAFHAALARADCTRLTVIVSGAINPNAHGAVQVRIAADLGASRTRAARSARIQHGRWQVTLELAGIDRDAHPPIYTITVRVSGSSRVAPAQVSKRITLEVEPASNDPR
jgi:hypothetical protein